MTARRPIGPWRSERPVARGRGLLQRAAGAAAALSCAAALLTGCVRGPAPEDTARALAEGLAAGDLTRVSFDGATAEAATASVKAAYGDLAQTQRTVTVAKVEPQGEDDRKASATLAWTWDVSDAPSDWTYTTEASLALAGDDTWHVAWSPTLVEPGLTASERLRAERTQPERAQITGAGGAVLMGLRDVHRIGIDKGTVSPQQASASAAALAQVLGIDPTGYVKAVTSAGPTAFVLAITLRADDPLLRTRSAAIAAVPGATSFPDRATLAPTASFARGILGTVGPATAEIVEKSGGRVVAGDVVGLSGLQQRYDPILGGVPGVRVRAVGTDPAGAATSRVLFTQEPVPGSSLATTLDPGAQNAAEAALGADPRPTALVAVRPSTGDVLAAASGPLAAGSPLATTGRAPPGSTFKVVTSLALLRAGLTPDSPVRCDPTVAVDGRSFKNYSDYPPDRVGSISLRTALAYSCNTAFISQRATVSQADLASAAAALGIGVDWDLGLPAFVGSVPAEATATEHAASMIGQGRVQASTLAMATVAASVARGARVVPRIVDIPASAATDAGASPSATPLPTRPPAPPAALQPAEADALRSMMAAVVTEGSGRVLAGSGATGAKTGTAEYGTDIPPKTHGWMIAIRGDLAVAAFVQDGASGSGSAGPLLAAFLAAYPG